MNKMLTKLDMCDTIVDLNDLVIFGRAKWVALKIAIWNFKTKQKLLLM